MPSLAPDLERQDAYADELGRLGICCHMAVWRNLSVSMSPQ